MRFRPTLIALLLLQILAHYVVGVDPVRAETQDLPDNSLDRTFEEISVDDLVDDTGQTIEDAIDTGIDSGETIVEDTVTGIGEQIDDTIDDVDQGIDDVTGADSIDDAIEGADSIVDAIGGGIDDILGQIDSAIDSLFNIFDNTLPDLDEIFAKVEDVISIGGDGGSSESVGATGIPDPEQIEQQIDQSETKALEELLATYQADDSGSPLIKDDAEILYNVELGREAAEASALGEDAQERIKASSELAKTALEQSTELAEDSEDQDVTQNIMRNISVQTAAQQQTDTLLANDALLRQRDDAIRNVLTADAVQQLQRDRTAARRTDASAFSNAILQGAQFGLPSIYPSDSDD